MATTQEEKQPVLLPRNVFPSKYKVHLEPHLDTFVLDGVVDISVTVSEATSTVSLHSRDIDFRKVTFKSDNEGSPTLDVTHITTNLGKAEYPYVTTFTFTGALPVGEGVLHIEYQGELNDKMAGFYRSRYKSVDGEERFMASTQFEATDARRCLPCWDEPDAKATFECSLTVAAHLTAFSNMPETNYTLLPGGKKRIEFEETPRMSTYLLAFCVGEFDFVQTYTQHRVAVRVYTPPGKKAEGEFALDAAVRSLDFYDDFFGIPYPLPKLDMVAIPEFAMGAMENWGLVTYREVDLLIDAQKASSQQKQRVCTVVTHELAHQWFGNLVTMKWWDNLWLNEGFASWMQNFAADALYPEWKMWDQFTINAMTIARSKDALRSSHPIQVPIGHASEVEEVFDAISYYKGACVVRMVFAVVGEEHFRAGLQAYFTKHGYGNTITSQLWDAWSEASGKDVAGLMGKWTNRMGYPVVTVTNVDEATGDITLSQEWFLSDGSTLTEEEQDFVWNLPLMIATSETGLAATPKMVMMTGKTHVLPGAAKDGAAVLLNAGQQSLYRVNYGPVLLPRLAAAISDLTSIDCASLVSDGTALAKAGKVGLDQVLRIVTACAGKTDYIVWDTVSSTMGYLKSKIPELGDNIKELFTLVGRKLAVACFADRGWNPSPADGHLDTLLRAVGISMSLAYNQGDAALIEEVRGRVKDYAAHPATSTALAGDLKVPAFRYLLKNGVEGDYDMMMQIYNAVDSTVEKKNVLLSLGAVSSDEKKLQALEFALQDVKKQDFFYVFHGVASSGAEGRQITFEFFRNRFEDISVKLKGASPSLMNAVILYSCSGFSSHEKADELQKLLTETLGEELKLSRRCVDQMLETMRANADFIEGLKKSSVVDEDMWKALLESIP